MKKTIVVISGLATFFCFGFFSNSIIAKETKNKVENKKLNSNPTLKKEDSLTLGAFSISLNVKNLNASKQFYENLGFKLFAGSIKQNYVIMKNENSLIGLFQGMFQGNILTFNPGWDENAQNTKKFDDVRVIQKHLKSKNIKLITEADETNSGPASIMLNDPDGNVILIDQHR